ncbi:MAG: flagellar filament capping protein FliD, partial [Agathobacter sp.]|nr:flagellar filament capping protein FliD [Agathobacter sp.]
EKLANAIQQIANDADAAANIKANAAEYQKGAAVKITGQDAEIELNGVHYTSETNGFVINGLTINAQAETKDGPITITTNVDTQAIYDKIKDFLTEYNNVINEMTKLYNAESASDYEPLTDEEKEAMSEEQIEKWEDKIKGALLRRDGSLNSIMSTMVNSMSQSFEVDGVKLSLGSFGISTLGFLNSAKDEQYAYHIDGDEDDENTSGKKDKLMKAIEENPDQLMGFMQKLMGSLYENIDKKMKSTELSSAYKVYNDKEMDKEATRIEQMIKKWEDKISDKEEYYYDKFTQMEVALSKLQNQTSSISGLLGGMQ